MTTISHFFLAASIFQLVSCGNAWFYQTPSQPASQLVKQQFLLPPYPQYEHELLQHHHHHHQQPSPLHSHDNRYYGVGEFAEPTSYNELSFEGPYEVTAPRVPGLYFRLSSGVFVPVKAVYSFPPFLERVIQRIQGYYSVYNPPESLGLDRPLPGGGIHPQVLPPTLDILPVLPPHLPPPPPPGPEETPIAAPEPTPESPKPEEKPAQDDDPTPSTTTEATREETTPQGEISSTDTLESTTDSPSEETTSI